MLRLKLSLTIHKKFFQTRIIHVPVRLNPTINRLNKTRTIGSADTLFADKEEHLAELRTKAREKAKQAAKESEKLRKDRRDEKWAREHAYETLMKGEDGEGSGLKSNEDGFDEDDFM